MKFNLNDFIELDTKELLGVNGGGGCSGTSSLSGGKSNGNQGSKKTGGSLSGNGGTPARNSDSSSTGGSSGGGNCSSCGSGNGGGSTTVHGGPDGSPAYDKNGAPVSYEEHYDASKGGNCSGVDLKYWHKEYEKNLIKKLEKSINDNIKDKKYVKGVYMCDDWVQGVLAAAGIDYKKYFAGAAKDKTCEEHIANLKNGNKKYSTEVPTDKGVYVVLMNDGHKYAKADGTVGTFAAHTGLLVISDSGVYFADNSSGNYNGTGGVEKTTGKTASSVIKQYGYDSFYYQRVN